MRIVSLVPSWTETLLEAGADVVGRTRFCIHPLERVEEIPVVGGTKRANLERIAALRPDLVVLDEEENTREIAEGLTVPWHASRVRGVGEVADELASLAAKLADGPSRPGDDPAERLRDLASRWRRVGGRPHRRGRILGELPGVIEWFGRPGPGHDRLVYLIWRRPEMAVAPHTFIGSVLRHLGFGDALLRSDQSYPEIDLAALDPSRTVLLFSTEPFPFARYRDVVADCGFTAALVDGEAYSWFGVRTLRFLEGELQR